MILFMWKKLLGKLGGVMVRMGTHLLLLSRKNLASLQQDVIVSGYKKVSLKRRSMMVR